MLGFLLLWVSVVTLYQRNRALLRVDDMRTNIVQSRLVKMSSSFTFDFHDDDIDIDANFDANFDVCTDSQGHGAGPEPQEPRLHSLQEMV